VTDDVAAAAADDDDDDSCREDYKDFLAKNNGGKKCLSFHNSTFTVINTHIHTGTEFL
jgi:hypothetical protein